MMGHEEANVIHKESITEEQAFDLSVKNKVYS